MDIYVHLRANNVDRNRANNGTFLQDTELHGVLLFEKNLIMDSFHSI